MNKYLFYLILGFVITSCDKNENSKPPVEDPILIQYFIDTDKDNYGNPDQALSKMAETKPDGYAENDLDCDDENELINPLADDYAYDGLDFNCDGISETIITSFSKTYGGNDLDAGQAIVATNDGGYIIAASSASIDGDVLINKGDYDVWLMKIDGNGDLQWQKTYGGSSIDRPSYMIETTTGDFLIIGNTGSVDGDVGSTNGLLDYWLLKINANGDLLWQETYGGSLQDYPRAIIESANGQIALIGASESPDGDVTGNRGDLDVWFAILEENGTLITSVTFGGSGLDRSEGMIEDQNGNYIISATTYSEDGDLTGINDSENGGMNWIFKIDKSGNILSNKVYGGESTNTGIEIINTSDGGYLAGGFNFSNNQDLSSNGAGDVWVMKFSEDDEMTWQMNFGGSKNDYVRRLLELEDGYMILCNVFSGDGDIERNYGTGNLEAILLKIDLNGNIKWQKNYGGSSHDGAYDIIKTLDGGYFMIGDTGSTNFDVEINKGRTDLWLLKLDPEFNYNRTQ